MSSDEQVKNYYATIMAQDIGLIARELLGSRITSRSIPHCTSNKSTPVLLHADCPHHASQSHTSLHIDTQKQLFHCWGCNVGGDLLQFVEFIQSGKVTVQTSGTMPDTHRAARDWLAKRVNLPPLNQLNLSPEEIAALESRENEARRVFDCLTAACAYWNHFLINSPEHLAAFQTAYAISLDTIKTYLIGFTHNAAYTDPAGVKHPGTVKALRALHFTDDEIRATGAFQGDSHNHTTCFFQGRYSLPYWSRGQVRYLIARKSKWTEENEYEKAKYKKLPVHSITGKSPKPHISLAIDNTLLHNEDVIATNPPYLLFAEGITDNYAAMERSIPSISPVTTTIPAHDWPRILGKLKKHRGKPVYLTPDNEVSRAGNRGAEKTAAILERNGHTVKIVELPLTPAHQEARSALATEFSLTEGATAPFLTETKQQFVDNPTRLARLTTLLSAAKMDLNDYFLDPSHSAETFHSLLQESTTRLEGVINSSLDRLRAKDDTLLEDAAFLAAFSEAQLLSPSLFQRVLNNAKGMKVALNRALKRYRANHQFSSSDSSSCSTQPTLSSPSISGQLSSDTPERSLHDIFVEASIPIPLDYTPLLQQLVAPPPFAYSLSGVSLVRMGEMTVEHKPVSPRVTFISRRIEDAATGIFHLEIMHYTPHGWRSLIAPREVLFDSRKIITLAAQGLSVGSDTSALQAKHYLDFESVNYAKLPTDKVSSQLGWQTKIEVTDIVMDNFKTEESSKTEENLTATGDPTIESKSSKQHTPPLFLYGTTSLTLSSDNQSSNLNQISLITFRAPDAGEVHLAAGFCQSGDLATSLSVFREAITFPRVAVLIYAALTAPLLKIFNLGSFIVDLSYPTSVAKTIALRLAMSLFGNPDERTPNTCMHSWSATKVAIERICSVQSDLPIALDDTQTATLRQGESFDSLVYLFAEGHGKGRGTRTGLQAMRHWRTVGLSTGEGGLDERCTNGGARARILAIKGLPFDRIDQATRERVTRLNTLACLNYGHLAPLFIQYLIDKHGLWSCYRSRFTERANSYAVTTGIAGRSADIRAAIEITGEIFHEFAQSILPSFVSCLSPSSTLLPVPPFSSPFVTLWEDITYANEQADVGRRSLEAIHAWACQHEEEFFGRHITTASSRYSGDSVLIERIPSKGWAGRWDQGAWQFIGFYHETLLRAFREYGGFDLQTVLTAWKAHDWLITDGRNLARACSMNRGSRPRLYCLKRSAFEEVIGKQFDSEEERCRYDEENSNVVDIRTTKTTLSSQSSLSTYDTAWSDTQPAQDEEGW